LAKTPENRYKNYEELLDDLYPLIPIGLNDCGIRSQGGCFHYRSGLIALVVLLCRYSAWTAIAQLAEFFRYRSWTSWILPLLALISLPFLYIAFIGSGRRSLGRTLFQIRGLNGTVCRSTAAA
jgi:hypothetical protein